MLMKLLTIQPWRSVGHWKTEVTSWLCTSSTWKAFLGSPSERVYPKKVEVRCEAGKGTVREKVSKRQNITSRKNTKTLRLDKLNLCFMKVKSTYYHHLLGETDKS